MKKGVWEEQKKYITFHLKIAAVEPGPAESGLSGRSSAPLANTVASWRGAVSQSNPHITMLTATRDYIAMLDPPYRQALGWQYTVYLATGTQHVVKHDFFTKRVTPV